MSGLHILMIDDSETDILLIGEVLRDSGMIQTFNTARNGEEAIQFLTKRKSGSNLPDLILLDINMPKMDGHETLVYLKSHSSLKHIPVVILTSSTSIKDIMKAYQEYTNSYIVKPYDIADLETIVETIKSYWQKTVKLPPNSI